jgi:hypothetical protein
VSTEIELSRSYYRRKRRPKDEHHSKRLENLAGRFTADLFVVSDKDKGSRIGDVALRLHRPAV